MRVDYIKDISTLCKISLLFHVFQIIHNPPFNVDKVKAEAAQNAGRLPFGLPAVNAAGEFGNANYLWISYFYAYLNEHGRAGFVMASSATDSQSKDKNIREQLIETGHVDVMISVGNNFFYTKSLPCSLWFFDKGKPEALRDKVLFIDARNYFTVVDRTLNEWSEWQLKNLAAIVWLYRGDTDKYAALLQEYHAVLGEGVFADTATKLEEQINTLRVEAKAAVDVAAKRDKKSIQAQYDEQISSLEETLIIAKEACWLYEKFGKGFYSDISGLCRLASTTEVASQGYSLNPIDYVGAQERRNNDKNNLVRIKRLKEELSSLQSEALIMGERLHNALEVMHL